jgi:hypothetical protein
MSDLFTDDEPVRMPKCWGWTDNDLDRHDREIVARALREAADDLWPAYHRGELTTADAWLRARAETIESGGDQ